MRRVTRVLGIAGSMCLVLAGCQNDLLKPGPPPPAPTLSSGPLPTATMDIQPNIVRLSGTGATNTLTVYVFSTATFDATQIQPASTRLYVGEQGAGAPVATRNGSYFTSTRDYNNDGQADRMLVFMVSEVRTAGLRGCTPDLILKDETSGFKFFARDPTTPTTTGGTAVASINVTPDSSAIATGSTRKLLVSAVDGGGQPIHGCLASWANSEPAAGAVDKFGLFRAAASVPSSLVTLLTATVEGKSDAAKVRVAAPSPLTTEITASPTLLNVDATATITVRIKDDAGDLLGNSVAAVALSASAGSVGAVTNNGDGTYTAIYTAPGFPASVTISGTLDGAPIVDTETLTVGALTWTGAVSTDWFVPGNWNLNVVPTASNDVVIPLVANQPVLTANAAVHGLRVTGGATLNLSAFNLTAGGSVVVERTPVASAITSSSGRLFLSGLAQTVGGNLSRMTVTGTYSATDNVTIQQTLRVTSGRLRSTGFRIRVSN